MVHLNLKIVLLSLGATYVYGQKDIKRQERKLESGVFRYDGEIDTYYGDTSEYYYEDYGRHYDDSDHEYDDYDDNYDDYHVNDYETPMNSLLEERMNRKDNKYVPFNSLTFSQGKVSKNKLKVPDSVTEKVVEATSPWWKKTTKRKTTVKPFWKRTTQKKTTTKPTTKPTKPASTETLTTWFPIRSTPPERDYFSRPLDHNNHKESEPAKSQGLDSSYQLDNIKDVIKSSTSFDRIHHVENNEIGNSGANKNHEESHKRLPTLTEVSNLFEEYYSYVQYYPWRFDEENVKRIFIKILEDFLYKSLDFSKKKQLKNFLQKKVFTYSNIAKKLVLDFKLYNRYNFIVSDLIERKLNLESKLETSTNDVNQDNKVYEKNYFGHVKDIEDPPSTKSTIYSSKFEEALNLSKKRPLIKPTENVKVRRKPGIKRKFKWKPDKTPNSPKNKQEELHQYYPQSSLWPENELPHDLQISPMFGQKPADFKLNSELFFHGQSGKWDK